MNFRLSDTQIIGLLVLALFLQVLLLFWHLGFLTNTDESSNRSKNPRAGRIVLIENSMKKRPLNSLIWESSEAPSDVHFYDSILTLSESSAKIELDNGTQVSLAENTLVTIEPTSNKKNQEIRIHFSRGNLKARNPYEKATIQDKSLSLKLSKNSDVEIFKTVSGKYEIQVNQGTAKIDKGEKQINLNKNEILAIDGLQTVKTQI